MKKLNLFDFVKATAFVLAFVILGFISCEKSTFEASKNIIPNIEIRSTRIDTIFLFADTLNKKLKIDFGFKTILFEPDSNGYYKVVGEPGIDMIKQNVSPVENLIVIDNLHNADTLYFDENDDIIAYRPCCSRPDFVKWYDFFKDRVWDSQGAGPEIDAMCQTIPVCGGFSYVSAVICCCYYGTGPRFIGGGYEIEHFALLEFTSL
jgi:hypothetical protein